ncbi:hypothetical protein V757_11650 [Pelistega indica]|uniref:Uncharacterized protein n=1 Tax=Pelistega indica TaxID=1414851 RepID=V8FTF7_9BURK|nr:hypothetical protein [Pelistega indica]ETD67176.1 hypothetical protein V757_11650 [Pelistega indica]
MSNAKSIRLPNSLGHFYLSKNVEAIATSTSKKGLLSHRLATLAKTYGVPVPQICRLAKISQNEATHFLNGSYDDNQTSVLAIRLSKVLDDLEEVLPYLDAKHYRPRTWSEALALCLSHRGNNNE